MLSTGGTKTTSLRFTLLLAVAVMYGLTSSPALAQTDWIGISGGGWDVLGNWSNGIVPGFANEDVVNNTPWPIAIYSGSYTINSFTSTNPSANFQMFGGSLTASVPGVSTFSTAGQLSLQNNASMGYWLIAADGGVFNFGNTRWHGSANFTNGTNYTAALNTNTTVDGTIGNTGNFLINGGAGTNSYISLDGGMTLSGAGRVTLNTEGGGGNAIIQGNGFTLTNNSTLQGNGVIGNGSLALANYGTINANAAGSTLTLNGTGGVINGGNLIASGGGALWLEGVTVNNAGGSITANAAGDAVQLAGADIQGGTINGIGGGFFGTPTGSTARIDGLTHGAMTVDGTYTVSPSSGTFVQGIFQINGNIQVNAGAGNDGLLYLYGDATFQGHGAVTLNTASGGGFASIEGSGQTLTNNTTIQGNGIIGADDLSLVNGALGKVLATVGGTLIINGGGTVTNSGTFEADAGSTLHLEGVTFTNFSGNTLTWGRYIANGTLSAPGTIQIDSLGTSGGEIVNNAARIILNGPNSNFVDAAGLDALSHLAANTTARSNLTVTGGRNLTTSGDFSNAGTVCIGTGSTIQIGPTGTNTFTQTGGVTTVSGTLSGASINLQGGVLGGIGFVIGNVLASGGVIAPGAAKTFGELTINGNLDDTGSTLDIRLGGTGAGQIDVLDVNGNVILGAESILDLSLINGFTPTNGETFKFVELTGSLTSQMPDYFGTVKGFTTPGGMFSLSENGDPSLTLTFHSNQNPNGTPEPNSVALLVGLGPAGLGVHIIRRLRK